jgi:hypothetical protein
MWKYHEMPLVRIRLVVEVAEPSLIASGTVVDELSQLKE